MKLKVYQDNNCGTCRKALKRLSKMTTDEAIEQLSTNGNPVKRPFVLTDSGGMAGFKETEWRKLVG